MDWKMSGLFKNRHFHKYDNTLDLRPLPSIVKDILKISYNILPDVSKINTVEAIGLTLYPASYFSPKNYHSGRIKITQNTYTIHHFDGSWIDKGLFFIF
ncbi:MAG: hypothetical protein LBS09_04985 [Bacteroidales bacterium]|jgi:hypothetical protein|nr:hypothetical protein [Bacteroidales bacterium]